jgi:hypothetical protein
VKNEKDNKTKAFWKELKKSAFHRCSFSKEITAFNKRKG